MRQQVTMPADAQTKRNTTLLDCLSALYVPGGAGNIQGNATYQSTAVLLLLNHAAIKQTTHNSCV
jgi:hypothetical protein